MSFLMIKGLGRVAKISHNSLFGGSMHGRL